MMLNKSLVVALIVTIATLCGLFYFSALGSTLSNGQLVTLCIGALAWLVVLFLPNHTPQADANNLSHNFSDLLSNIQTELTNHITATEAELAQVKSLMDNAIDDLVDSFISLETTTRIGQNLVRQMASSKTDTKDDLNPFKDKQAKSQRLLQETSEILKKLMHDAKQNQLACTSLAESNKNIDAASSKILSKILLSSDDLRKETKLIASKVADVIQENKDNLSLVADELTATTKQIEKDVQTAVKSLQFQDMTTQLITQCGERQKIMQQILHTANAIGNKDSGQISASELQAKLKAASAELKQISSARMKQFNVDAGHVELFD
jgi:hypothetical protein